MEVIREFIRTIDELLHLSTLPMAIRFVRDEQELPDGTGRPARDLGEPIRPCTAFHLVRHQGHSLAMLEEDFSTGCPAGFFIFGITEPMEAWIRGDLSNGIYTGSSKAAAKMEESIFCLDPDQYKGIIMAPLAKADFEPDLVMIYCNSKQAMRLVTAATYKDGEPLEFSMAARGLCSDGVVQPFLIDRPVVALPCGGDRLFGVAQDHELVFTTPLDRLEEITKGLWIFEKTHSVNKLGGTTELRDRYTELSRELDKKLGRTK